MLKIFNNIFANFGKSKKPVLVKVKPKKKVKEIVKKLSNNAFVNFQNSNKIDEVKSKTKKNIKETANKLSKSKVFVKSKKKSVVIKAKAKKKVKDTVKKISKSKVYIKSKKIQAKVKEIVATKFLVKSEQNPIILPKPENSWEAWQTFNPGVVFLDDKIHFLYRGIGHDGISRLGYVASDDGFTINERLSYPVYEHNTKDQTYNIYSYLSGGSFGGAEDPRMVLVNDEDRIYVTYTACGDGLRVALTSIKVDDLSNQRWKWKKPILISPPGEVHKNWMIFPEKINGRYAILHSIKPKIQIEYLDNLEFKDIDCINSYHGGGPQKDCWDKWLRGAGAPPLKTKDGWLLFYHAMDDDWSKYKVGAMLLDLEDPTKILYRAQAPVLEPSEDYENNGYKAGVVYVSGAVIKDGNLLVYYGASDSFVGVACAPLEEFLSVLKQGNAPKLKVKKLKKK